MYACIHMGAWAPAHELEHVPVDDDIASFTQQRSGHSLAILPGSQSTLTDNAPSCLFKLLGYTACARQTDRARNDSAIGREDRVKRLHCDRIRLVLDLCKDNRLFEQQEQQQCAGALPVEGFHWSMNPKLTV